MKKSVDLEKTLFEKVLIKGLNSIVYPKDLMIFQMIVLGLLFGLIIVPADSQVPRDNTPAKKTYRKCERAGSTFSECKECDDKAMTVNCKTLWCTNDGTCIDKPFRPQAPQNSINSIQNLFILSSQIYSLQEEGPVLTRLFVPYKKIPSRQTPYLFLPYFMQHYYLKENKPNIDIYL